MHKYHEKYRKNHKIKLHWNRIKHKTKIQQP